MLPNAVQLLHNFLLNLPRFFNVKGHVKTPSAISINDIKAIVRALSLINKLD